jgi:hypothetical protein
MSEDSSHASVSGNDFPLSGDLDVKRGTVAAIGAPVGRTILGAEDMGIKGRIRLAVSEEITDASIGFR